MMKMTVLPRMMMKIVERSRRMMLTMMAMTIVME